MTERFAHADMADEIEKQAFAKRLWLSQFSSGGNRRPDHEIETKRRELVVLEQAVEDYKRAAARVG